MKKRLLVYLTILFSVCSHAVSVAEVVSDPRMLIEDSPIHKFVYSEASYRKMYEVAVFQDRKLSIECGTRYDIKPQKLVIMQPITMEEGVLEPSAGVWKYQFEALRCGKTKIYNMIYGVQNGILKNVPLFPGNTISSPMLLRDAVRAAIGGAIIKSKSKCSKDLQVYDVETIVLPEASSSQPEGSWVDKWTFLACGEMIISHMVYVPDGNGGTSFHSK